MSSRLRLVRRLAIVGVSASIIALTVPAAIGGTGVGAVFNLGRTNSVNRTSVLTGNYSSRILQITNGGTGTALALTTRSNVPPMKVSSSAKVSNLNADRLDGLDSSAFLQPTGQVQVALGNAGWTQPSSTGSLTESQFTTGTAFRASTTGARFIVATPDLPVSLFGRAVELRAVEFCYATGAGTFLDTIEINRLTSTAGESTQAGLVFDQTDRSGTACTLFTLATPAPLTADDSMTMWATINWTSAGTDFTVKRTTFILGATGQAAPAVTSSQVIAGPAPEGAEGTAPSGE